MTHLNFIKHVYYYLAEIYLSVLIMDKSLVGFVAYFFSIFTHWIWSYPIKFHMTKITSPDSLILCVQNPVSNILCNSNVTKWTRCKIKMSWWNDFIFLRVEHIHAGSRTLNLPYRSQDLNYRINLLLVSWCEN